MNVFLNAFKAYGNSNGSRRKYVDIKCLLCLMKFALTKKCCLNIHIYLDIYIDVIDFFKFSNTNYVIQI